MDENLDATVIGLFNLLPNQIQREVVYIQQIVPYPKRKTRQTLARKLYELHPDVYGNEKRAERAVRQAWDLSKDLNLSVNGRTVSFIKRDGSRYAGNLRNILLQLRPKFDKRQILDWEQTLLREFSSLNGSGS